MTFRVHRSDVVPRRVVCFTIPSNPRRLSPCNQPYLTFFLSYSLFSSSSSLTSQYLWERGENDSHPQFNNNRKGK